MGKCGVIFDNSHLKKCDKLILFKLLRNFGANNASNKGLVNQNANLAKNDLL